MYIDHALDYEGSYFHTPGCGWHGRVLRVLVIQIQYNLDIASLLTAEGCWCKHQEGSKLCGLSRFYSWAAELERLWWCPTPSPPCRGTFFLIRLEFGGSWACRLRHWKPALWKCPYQERRWIFLMFKPMMDVWSRHCFSNSKSVFPVERASAFL